MQPSAVPVVNPAAPPESAPPAGTARIFLVAEDPRSRARLRALLEQSGATVFSIEHPDIDIPRGSQGLAPPDVVLLGVEDGPQGEASLQRACKRWQGVPVLALVEEADFDRARTLVLAGARGVLRYDETAEHLVSAVQKVQEHELWLDRASVARLIEELSAEHAHSDIIPPDPRFERLTQRELEIVDLVAQGLCNKSIAARLDISDNTVRHHLTSIFLKLGVSDRLALAVFTLRHRRL